MRALSFERAFMAAEHVRERLHRTTAALDRHGVPYAVIGGHAVAAHVARVDCDAVRNTNDVDILLRRDDWMQAVSAMQQAGFDAAEVAGIPMFVDRDDPSPRRGVHVVFAAERTRANDAHAAPDVTDFEVAEEGYRVVNLRALLIMKLTAFRRKDQVHVEDMLELNMLPREMVAQLPADLRARLDEIRASMRPEADG